MSLRHWSGFTSSPMTSVCIRYPSPVPCHAFPFPVDKSLCLSIWSIKCCKFCDEGQSIKFLEHVCASYRGAASMLLTVFDSYWRKIDDLNPPHIRAPLLTSLVLGHPPFFFMPSHSIYQTCFQQSKARKSLSFLRKIFCVILSRCRANKKKKGRKKEKLIKKGVTVQRLQLGTSSQVTLMEDCSQGDNRPFTVKESSLTCSRSCG